MRLDTLIISALVLPLVHAPSLAQPCPDSVVFPKLHMRFVGPDGVQALRRSLAEERARLAYTEDKLSRVAGLCVSNSDCNTKAWMELEEFNKDQAEVVNMLQCKLNASTTHEPESKKPESRRK